MRRAVKYCLLFWAFAYHVGCSKVKFERDASQDPCLSSPMTCSYINGLYNWHESINPTLGKVDILIVDDNSGSMSYEQSNMAQRFQDFVSNLDKNHTVNYRIGITTTDISSSVNPPRGINQNGELQDGGLIRLSNGAYYIDSSVGSDLDRQLQFASAIQRPETIQCEKFVKNNPAVSADSSEYLANCPSGDERGIYAANLSVQKNPQGFIRPEAHLAIVFLSDEDVRSSNYSKSSKYRLSIQDLPSELIKTINQIYPGKSFSAHSIIVRPGAFVSGVSVSSLNSILADDSQAFLGNSFSQSPSGEICLSQQSNQIPGAGFGGSYGYLYSLLTRATGGTEGDICAADYGSQLSNLGSSIAEKLNQITLKCSSPQNLVVKMNPTNTISYSLEGASLKFSEFLPIGTQVSLNYSCSPN